MRFVLLVLAAFSLCLMGCSAPVDKGCTSDSQCRPGRVCVDGLCSGDVDPNNENNPNNNRNNSNSRNNSNGQTTENNLNSENNEPNNITPNADPNNVNGETNNANNMASTCDSNGDCAGQEVCASEGPGEEYSCREPWSCEFNGADGSSGGCALYWFCEGAGDLTIKCEFENPDEGRCACISDDRGEFAAFESQNGICIDGDSETANLNCPGWRISRPVEF